MRKSLLCATLLVAGAAQAEPAAVIVADHPTSGRLIVQLPTPTKVSVRQHGARVDVKLSTDARLDAPDPLPRNVLDFVSTGRTATLTVLPGARVKWAKAGPVLVIDILDPPPGRESARLEVPPRLQPGPAAAGLPGSATPATVTPPPVVAQPAPVPAASAPPGPAPVTPAPPAPAPNPEPVQAEQPAPEPAEPKFSQVRFAAAPQVGAAAFRRGNAGVAVFDEEIEPAAGEAGKLGPATVEHKRRETIVTVPLSDSDSLVLSHDPAGWLLRTGTAAGSPAAQTAAPDGIAFQFAQPGRVVTMQDPVTGQLLLLGTTRATANSAVAAGRSAPGYDLLPTWLGVVVALSSDSVDLHASMSGFTLEIPDPAAPARVSAAVRDNQFGIPNLPKAMLTERLRVQLVRAAAAPARGRGPERVEAARIMLGLGMAAEAQALLTLASDGDPAIANDPSVAALSGIAAVLAGRPAEAGGLDNPALPTNDEMALWRGLRDAAQGAPAPTLAAAVPLLQSYPPAVQREIDPPVIEAAILAGEPVPPEMMEGGAMAFARALQKQKAGDTEGALQAFDALERSRDERQSVRAAAASTELRLAKGLAPAADAAERFDRLALRWRGDAQETGYRLRAAELRIQAGQWRAALDSLKETETLSPAAKPKVAALRAAAFKALLTAKDPNLTPLDWVGLAGDFGASIPDMEDSERMAGLLAEKLAALDLPSRAIPVLRDLADKAGSQQAKIEFTFRLAQMQLEAGDPAAAEIVLGRVDTATLDPARAERRSLLLARAKAARGDSAGAVALLTQSTDPAADEFRASLLAKSGDWRGSLAALETVAARTIPESGDLDAKQQDLLLRLATAAVQSGDPEAIRRAKRFETRITPPRADLFHVLTAASVDSPQDLPRAARELAMSRALPDRLNALRTP